MKNKEFIICSAIWLNDGLKHNGQPKNIETGFVICGRRHSDCYSTINILCGIDKAINLKKENSKNASSLDDFRKYQGFITSLNRYVDRKEAWIIAKANNQIQFGLEATENGEDSYLISENLY